MTRPHDDSEDHREFLAGPPCPCVFIPQHPTRMGHEGPERMPLDLTDAERYGRICELLEPGAKPFDPSSVAEIDATIADSGPDDWLLCIGNPTLIAVAAGALALAHGRLNMLQWQSRKGHYEAIRITYLDMSEGGGTLLEVVTIPPGEDDDRREG